MTRVPILMYHSISERPPATTASLSVGPEAFAEQMALLKDRGFSPVTLSDLAASHALPDRPVVITFDDGYADFHEQALPVLERFGFAATVFVTTGWLADAGPQTAGRPLDRMLSWGQVQESCGSGVEIGGHSHSHPQLDQLCDRALLEELTRNKALLEDRLGAGVQAMAYPYGYSSARVRRAALQAGYATACVVANRVAAGGGGGWGGAATGAEDAALSLPRLTIRRATSLERFGRVLDGTANFRKDRALTKGYAVLRRSRYAARRVLRRV